MSEKQRRGSRVIIKFIKYGDCIYTRASKNNLRSLTEAPDEKFIEPNDSGRARQRQRERERERERG